MQVAHLLTGPCTGSLLRRFYRNGPVAGSGLLCVTVDKQDAFRCCAIHVNECQLVSTSVLWHTHVAVTATSFENNRLRISDEY